MLENFISKVEYVKWFSHDHSKANILPLANISSYADTVESKDIKGFVEKKGKFEDRKTKSMGD